MKRPSFLNFSKSPPASSTALSATSLNFLLFSDASLSLLAFVFELPLGATPVRIFRLSLGVKFTNPICPVGVLGARVLWDELHILPEDRLRLAAAEGDGERETGAAGLERLFPRLECGKRVVRGDTLEASSSPDWVLECVLKLGVVTLLLEIESNGLHWIISPFMPKDGSM